MRRCPSCDSKAEDDAVDCPACGVALWQTDELGYDLVVGGRVIDRVRYPKIVRASRPDDEPPAEEK